jgi:phosphoenolpyruvate carboxykinase (ATP)
MTKYLEFNTPATKQAEELASDYRLSNHGLTHLERVFWNLPEAALYEEAVFRNEGHMVYGGPLIVNTGKHTARAAADKFVVREHTTEDKIWWGEYNRPFSPDKFNTLLTRLQAFMQDEELFVQDCYAGASSQTRRGRASLRATCSSLQRPSTSSNVTFRSSLSSPRRRSRWILESMGRAQKPP